MAALRAYHILHGLDTNPFKDERLALYLKSLRIQAPLAPARHCQCTTLDTNCSDM